METDSSICAYMPCFPRAQWGNLHTHVTASTAHTISTESNFLWSCFSGEFSISSKSQQKLGIFVMKKYKKKKIFVKMRMINRVSNGSAVHFQWKFFSWLICFIPPYGIGPPTLVWKVNSVLWAMSNASLSRTLHYDITIRNGNEYYLSYIYVNGKCDSLIYYPAYSACVCQ